MTDDGGELLEIPGLYISDSMSQSEMFNNPQDVVCRTLSTVQSSTLDDGDTNTQASEPSVPNCQLSDSYDDTDVDSNTFMNNTDMSDVLDKICHLSLSEDSAKAMIEELTKKYLPEDPPPNTVKVHVNEPPKEKPVEPEKKKEEFDPNLVIPNFAPYYDEPPPDQRKRKESSLSERFESESIPELPIDPKYDVRKTTKERQVESARPVYTAHKVAKPSKCCNIL